MLSIRADATWTISERAQLALRRLISMAAYALRALQMSGPANEPGADEQASSGSIQNPKPRSDNNEPQDTASDDPFGGGPLYKIQRVAGLLRVDKPNVLRRALLAVLICWLPLAVMTALPGHDSKSFWFDFGAHARYLVVVPLLIIAEGVCIPRISALACHFPETGIVTAADQHTFKDIIRSTQRLMNMLWVEIAVIALAYLFIAAIYDERPFDEVPAWIIFGSSGTLSHAGWWGVLVSLPILLCLLLSWLWRLCLWVRFLYLVSRLKLRLIPVHPDGAAGLGFVGYSSQAFSILAVAFGALVAGAIANSIYAGASLSSYHFLVLLFVLGVVLVFNLPHFVFLGQMLQAWRRGTLQYGGLADRFGLEFERKWLHDKAIRQESMMDRPDFSSATDLYQIVDRVYAMWLIPVHPKSVIMLAIAALIPFIPVALMALPFDVLVEKIAGLLL